MNDQKVPGKSYTWDVLAEVQVDFEKARLGETNARSKERTQKMVDEINAAQANSRGGARK